MSRSTTQRLLTRKVRGDEARLVPDDLIVEEPLSIELDGSLVASTMRTPGNDFELAAGFCFTEGLVGPGDVQTIRYCGGGSAVATEFNVVTVETGRSSAVATDDASSARRGLVSSSCGLCGSDAIHELADRIGPLPEHEPWDRDLLLSLPAQVKGHQPLHDATGAVHLAAAVDRSGAVVVAREDIGRHNAVDKVIGRLLLDRALPASDLALFVSSRASFEMVQKAWAGGFTALVAVSGPSALAVQSARRAGMTLAGFAREGRANFYSPDGA
ncbi:MAG: formate dehydrogenase accessory sulfurtransferase FdhD [Acidimicrobiales bacterium]